MKREKLLFLLATLSVTLSVSCEKQQPDVPDNRPTYVPVDPNPPSVYKYGLRELARANDLLLGTAFTYSEYNLDDSLRVILKRDFDAVTFGNEMKHDGIVQADGSFNFRGADVMAGWAKDCGVQLFGHTLGWHSQQQTDYLNKLTGEPASIREAHKNWVDAMVAHFDTYGWDVVNETLTDSGAWRSTANTQGGWHIFLWGTYYPGGTKEFVDAAFRSAREALEQAGKNAILYINDYNLEGGWATAKLEALCRYAEGNPDVTGVGSQMHISSDMNRDDFVRMLKRMVQTGKMVRISELDVTPGQTDQGETIVFIFDQYLKLVPKEQRGGITFWGVSDKRSWLGASKTPLLYDSAYKRKDCYRKLHAYLLERAGLE